MIEFVIEAGKPSGKQAMVISKALPLSSRSSVNISCTTLSPMPQSLAVCMNW
jgi:hypothetical protein